MKAATRLLASVGRSTQYLKPHSPTGLTGVYTHPAPRPHLIWLYSQILEKLKSFPETSVYRQSTEAITKHRLAIIEAAKPKGFDEWEARAKKHIEEHPEAYEPGSIAKYFEVKGTTYVLADEGEAKDDREEEWDGERVIDRGEGARGENEHSRVIDSLDREAEKAMKEYETRNVKIEIEPPLTANQVEDIEKEIGAGLLEEIVNVAQGEKQLVDTLLSAKIWEELEEKPAEGQWQYFERNTHVESSKIP